MLDGHMQHKDNFGNIGDLGPGGIQWMTAAHGIIHSEMPTQTDGRMRGFQLWINLPAAEKLKPASYADIPSSSVPEIEFSSGRIRVLAGELNIDGRSIVGAVNSQHETPTTQPNYFDLIFDAPGQLGFPTPENHNALLYPYEGEFELNGNKLSKNSAVILSAGDTLKIEALVDGSRALFLSAIPLKEPVAQYGPFVMNTREQLEQAMADYRDGVLATEIRASVR